MPAFICGGGQESGKRSGTENVPAIAGFGVAAEISEITMKESMAAASKIRDRLAEDAQSENQRYGHQQPGTDRRKGRDVLSIYF